MSSKYTKKLSIRKANEFDIDFPDNKNLKENEKNQIQKAVENGAIAIGIKTFVDSNKVPKLLNTDKKGVQIVLNNTPNEDVKQYGDIDYLSIPHIQKEIASRKEQPRSELEREKLEYASNCLKAFSDNSQLNKERNIENGRIVKERPKIGKKVIKERGSIVSEISGEPLNGDECVHHKNRVADKPEEAFDDDNLTVIKNNEHKEFHSSSYTQDKKGFEEYISKKNK
ncbi:hypothetical protein [Peptostreptococcus sp.]